MLLRSKFLWNSALATKDEVINVLYFVVTRLGRGMKYRGTGHKELDY
jgi:hypothetical protein